MDMWSDTIHVLGGRELPDHHHSGEYRGRSGQSQPGRKGHEEMARLEGEDSLIQGRGQLGTGMLV